MQQNKNRNENENENTNVLLPREQNDLYGNKRFTFTTYKYEFV